MARVAAVVRAPTEGSASASTRREAAVGRRRPALQEVAVFVDQIAWHPAGHGCARSGDGRDRKLAIAAVDGRARAVGLAVEDEEAAPGDGDVEITAGRGILAALADPRIVLGPDAAEVGLNGRRPGSVGISGTEGDRLAQHGLEARLRTLVPAGGRVGDVGADDVERMTLTGHAADRCLEAREPCHLLLSPVADMVPSGCRLATSAPSRRTPNTLNWRIRPKPQRRGASAGARSVMPPGKSCRLGGRGRQTRGPEGLSLTKS